MLHAYSSSVYTVKQSRPSDLTPNLALIPHPRESYSTNGGGAQLSLPIAGFSSNAFILCWSSYILLLVNRHSTIPLPPITPINTDLE